MQKFVASEFNQDPIRVGHGSLLPSEILKRAWFVLRRKIQSEEKPISLPIRIHRGYFDKAHDYSDAYPDRLFSRWVGQPDGDIVFDTTADGTPNVLVVCRSGEVLHDEDVMMTFTLDDIETLRRCEKAVSVSTSGAISTVSFGVFSVISDLIPVWAEVSAILGLAASSLQQRVRCLFEFKPFASDEAAEDQKQPFIIADLPEIAFILLDACLHQPFWQPESGVSAQAQVAQEPVTDQA